MNQEIAPTTKDFALMSSCFGRQGVVLAAPPSTTSPAIADRGNVTQKTSHVRWLRPTSSWLSNFSTCIVLLRCDIRAINRLPAPCRSWLPYCMPCFVFPFQTCSFLRSQTHCRSICVCFDNAVPNFLIRSPPLPVPCLGECGFACCQVATDALRE